MKITALLVTAAAITLTALTAHADTIDPAQAIAQKFSEASDPKPAPPQRTFTRPGTDYEEDMLERARVEDLERRQSETRKVAAEPTETIATQIIARPPLPVDPPLPVEPPLSKLAALPPKPPVETSPRAIEPTGPTISSATVLLALDPDGPDLGFKPDPIICIDNSCWLSNGMNAPARRLPRNQAVVLDSTANMTANSCSGKSGCVYRNVTIDPAHRIDVIEVGEAGGASAGAYTVATDRSCRTQANELLCDNGLATQNFRIWVVPEETAQAAGASGLEGAVAEGLPEADVTSANDK